MIFKKEAIAIDDSAFTRAIELGKKSEGEDDRIHPKVGVVIVKDNKIICESFRGELKAGEHAEYTALVRKCGSPDLTNATLITTLEPCTSRHHKKKPCAQHILERGIKKVIVGMIDPNPEIRGKGILFLQNEGIDVEMFPIVYQREVQKLNENFLRQEWRKYKKDLMKETTEKEFKRYGSDVERDFYGQDIHRIKIFEVLNSRLVEEEFKTFCEIYLGKDYDNLSGKTKFAKITELIRLYEREDSLESLLSAIKKFKPKLWIEIWEKIKKE